ncbi:MAG: hypothetical protein WBM26_12960 [Polyangiales bacterium]
MTSTGRHAAVPVGFDVGEGGEDDDVVFEALEGMGLAGATRAANCR